MLDFLLSITASSKTFLIFIQVEPSKTLSSIIPYRATKRKTRLHPCSSNSRTVPFTLKFPNKYRGAICLSRNQNTRRNNRNNVIVTETDVRKRHRCRSSKIVLLFMKQKWVFACRYRYRSHFNTTIRPVCIVEKTLFSFFFEFNFTRDITPAACIYE